MGCATDVQKSLVCVSRDINYDETMLTRFDTVTGKNLGKIGFLPTLHPVSFRHSTSVDFRGFPLLPASDAASSQLTEVCEVCPPLAPPLRNLPLRVCVVQTTHPFT